MALISKQVLHSMHRRPRGIERCEFIHLPILPVACSPASANVYAKPAVMFRKKGRSVLLLLVNAALA